MKKDFYWFIYYFSRISCLLLIAGSVINIIMNITKTRFESLTSDCIALSTVCIISIIIFYDSRKFIKKDKNY